MVSEEVDDGLEPVVNGRISSQQILAVCCKLREQGIPITPVEVANLMSLQLQRVEDHFKLLLRRGFLLRVRPGVYRVVEDSIEHRTARAMSLTWLPGGVRKFEIGDQVIELNPVEFREAAILFHGALAVPGPAIGE